MYPSFLSMSDQKKYKQTDPAAPGKVNIFEQHFLNAATNTLQWTENDGILPASNLSAVLFVYGNGQKLLTTQYTINHLVTSSMSELVIDVDTFIEGTNYQIIYFFI